MRCYMEAALRAFGYPSNLAGHIYINNALLDKYVIDVKADLVRLREVLDEAHKHTRYCHPSDDISEYELYKHVAHHIDSYGEAHTFSVVMYSNSGKIFAYGNEIIAKYDEKHK